jgi:diaminopimelate decarboxylase
MPIHASDDVMRLPADLEYRNGVLHFDNTSIGALAGRASSPFFLISRDRIVRNYAMLAAGLAAWPQRSRIRYCAKTNDEPAVLSAVAAAGGDLVVSHVGEAEQALRCGFSARQIAYQQPVLTPEAIERALALGLDFFHVFHLSDLRILEEVSGAVRQTVRVSLRLRSPRRWYDISPVSLCARRFGLSYDDALTGIGRILASWTLKLAGFNFYLGTQQTIGRGQHRRAARVALSLAARARAMDCQVQEINFGGGISSPSLRRNSLAGAASRLLDSPAWSDPEGSAARLAATFREELERSRLGSAPTLVIEPGRSLVSDAGVLVTRVRRVEGRWVFLDGSRNHLPESFVLFSRRILPVKEPGDHRSRFRHFSGGTLNTMDVIDMWRRVPALEPGDLIALCDAGAYSISRASRYAGAIPPVYFTTAGGVAGLSPVKGFERTTESTVAQEPRFVARGAGR